MYHTNPSVGIERSVVESNRESVATQTLITKKTTGTERSSSEQKWLCTCENVSSNKCKECECQVLQTRVREIQHEDPVDYQVVYPDEGY